MRIFTCTPRDFSGGEDFFSRDSGLLCRGLQAIGVFSRAVMPGARMPEDQDDLIRTEYRNLESAEWWRAQRLDGVVLYAWGRPRFRKVAAAIREAGIPLVLNQDNSGVVSPLNGPAVWLRHIWHQTGRGCESDSWRRLARLVAGGLTYGLVLTDPLRRKHLSYGDWIACVCPMAVEHYRHLCGIYGGVELADRVTLLPHPVEGRFIFTGGAKEERIVCVGRWADKSQKRPFLMMTVLERLLAVDPVEAAIVGTPTSEMERWHRDLPKGIRDRVRLHGHLGRNRLASLLAISRVFYSPSAYESFGIAAGEALCSGCSVVAADLASMGSFGWFTEEGCGSVAKKDNASGHLAALRVELGKWRGGSRSPQAISGRWCGILHERQVAKEVLKLVAASSKGK